MSAVKDGVLLGNEWRVAVVGCAAVVTGKGEGVDVVEVDVLAVLVRGRPVPPF